MNLDDLRSAEQDTTVLYTNYTVIHDLRPETKLEAGLGIGQTLFVCVVLATSAIIFTQTTNTLVINPIEDMIAKVNRISENPLLAAQEEENEALTNERILAEEIRKHGKPKRPKR